MIQQDPFLYREKKNYQNPIVSREYLIDLIKKNKTPLSFNDIVDLLEYQNIDDKKEALRRRLIAMTRDGQIFKNRKNGFLIVENSDFLSGQVQATSSSFGFFVPDTKRDDLVLYSRYMQQLMHGDRIIVRVGQKDKKGRDEAILVRVTQRAHTHIAGIFSTHSGLCFVKPDNKKLYSDIIIPQSKRKNAKNKDIVKVEILEYANKHHNAIGQVCSVLGSKSYLETQIESALINFNISAEFKKETLREAKNINKKISKEDIKRRKDLRDLNFVTIDGEDSKDFDDAVYCNLNNKGEFILYVAIADVSFFVKKNSNLETEALDRGTSVYLPEKVVPMLPEVLSNGLCSLLPNKDRLVLCCEIKIDNKGKIIKYEFYNSIIRSVARLTYDEVYELLIDQKDKDIQNKHKNIKEDLQNIYRLYKVLKKERKKRGALEFDTQESRILFNNDGSIKEVLPYERHDIHRLIEECMIMANVCCARFLQKHNLPGLYRVHDKPTKQKISDLKDFFQLYDINFATSKKPNSADFLNLYDSFSYRDDSAILSLVILRSLKQAYYSEKKLPHFGLALDNYAHFTSPIRRFADLHNHRMIKIYLEKQKITKDENTKELSLMLSDKKTRADEINYDVTDWLKCKYMVDKIGQKFDGIISSVTGFGVFVLLKKILVEGLVHITNLPMDYYHFDGKFHRLVGEKTHKMFKLGDKVKIKVDKIDLSERKIDFLIVK
jgi:ribonuclease R